MNIQFVEIYYNQKGTKIDLSHFISTCINLNNQFISYNKFKNDNLDAAFDVHDTSDAGVKIYTSEVDSYIYGISISSSDVDEIPIIKGTKIDTQNIKDGIYINIFILEKSTGRGIYAYYRNSLSIINFIRAINSYYDNILDKNRNKKNILRPKLSHEDFEEFIQSNFERIDAFVIKEDKNDIDEKLKTFSEGAFLERETVINCQINANKQEAFYSCTKEANIFNKIIKVVGKAQDFTQLSISKSRKKRISQKLDTDYTSLLMQIKSLSDFTNGFKNMAIFKELVSRL